MAPTWNFVLIVYIFVLFGTSLSAKEANSRRKRLLHFPKETKVVLTMSLLKLFPSDSILNTLTEYDVSFPVPLHPYELPGKRLKRQVERNTIHKKLETISNIINFDGDGSLKNLICVMKNSFNVEDDLEDNLLKDVTNILFNLEICAENCMK